MPAMEASASYLRRHVAALVGSLALRYRRVVVIHDSLMASTIQDVLSAGNVESYIFHSVSAFSIYWYIARTAGKQLTLGEYDHGVFLDDPPPLEVCFSAEFLKFVELQYKFRHLASGFLYNTSRVVEGRFMEQLEKETVNQKCWAVGPFNPVKLPSPPSPNTKPPQEHVKHRCIQWLNRHPQNSVIYVSFGTTVAQTNDQINQIATALENSGQRFVWVLREADKGDIFENGTEVALPLMMLPKGFEDRVEGTGLVVNGWAPQLEILGHAAVGGFLSHCGWNSCVESMSMGVPMVAWPMHSDQPCNSLLVTKVLKIGLDVEARWSPAAALCSGRVVEAASIERAVRVLMDSEKGDGMRRRAEELGQAVRGSVEKGGVSTAELDAFVSHIIR
ncbi:hypothetical protein SAY86_030472 [Trapa natans]|uniref:Glycosyltransferase N-terminal domain-containing protein n=1 Tax=Trapa natans TaxID=22666 RepID=A0AAN7M2Y2_TRANT|nr:hypothetical protein SAY86_030472 [Trapa natans]